MYNVQSFSVNVYSLKSFYNSMTGAIEIISTDETANCMIKYLKVWYIDQMIKTYFSKLGDKTQIYQMFLELTLY